MILAILSKHGVLTPSRGGAPQAPFLRKTLGYVSKKQLEHGPGKTNMVISPHSQNKQVSQNDSPGQITMLTGFASKLYVEWRSQCLKIFHQDSCPAGKNKHSFPVKMSTWISRWRKWQRPRQRADDSPIWPDNMGQCSQGWNIPFRNPSIWQ